MANKKIVAAIDMEWFDNKSPNTTIYQISVACSNGRTLELKTKPTRAMSDIENVEERAKFLQISDEDLKNLEYGLELENAMLKLDNFIVANQIKEMYCYGYSDIKVLNKVQRKMGIHSGFNESTNRVIVKLSGVKLIDFSHELFQDEIRIALDMLYEIVTGEKEEHTFNSLQDAKSLLEVVVNEKTRTLTHEEMLESGINLARNGLPKELISILPTYNEKTDIEVKKKELWHLQTLTNQLEQYHNLYAES